MNSAIKVDRISILPKNIIDSMLTRLPILEAVRTSILSRSWRYEWHSLSKIEINYPAFPGHDDLLQVSTTTSSNKIAEMIDHILLVHCGPVDKFVLTISSNMYNAIDRWILYLSRNGIKELIVKKSYGGLYNIPSCLFSCSELTHLTLTECIIKPPDTFKAFSNLTELSFDKVTITDKVLENLVNSCPLLRNLRLWIVDHHLSLKINAPNLVNFHAKVCHCYFQFTSTPLLASAYFRLRSPVSSRAEDNKDWKMVELLGSMPSIQRLQLHKYALQHLAVGDVPACLPLVSPIRYLIADVNFKDPKELRAALCIMRSSPFIQVLKLSVLSLSSSSLDSSRISVSKFWIAERNFIFRFDRLQKVTVLRFNGSKSEVMFIEFLLANAPALQTMYIEFVQELKDVVNIVAKLAGFPRISPNARLTFPSRSFPTN